MKISVPTLVLFICAGTCYVLSWTLTAHGLVMLGIILEGLTVVSGMHDDSVRNREKRDADDDK
jgi:hypothetical protein